MLKITLAALSLLIFLNGKTQNNALDLDGINDYIIVNDHNSLDISGDVTLEAWIKPEITSPEKTILIKGTVNQCVNYGIFLRLGNLAYLSGGDCGWNGRGPNSVVQLGVWQHVAAVASGNNVKLYINGVLKDNLTLASAIGNTNNQQLWIGNSIAGLPNYIDSSIDEIRIWNIARSGSEISDNMNVSLDCATPGLVAYYKFDQGNAGGQNFAETSLKDCTSNHNDGTLVNFSLNGSSSNWVSSEVILPVTWGKFDAHATENGVMVEWSTYEEVNNYGFEIQKSVDGKTWQLAGFVEGTNQESHFTNYQFFDDDPFPGVSYYRIKQSDFDGTSDFSDIIAVVFQNTSSFEVFPNPVIDEITIFGVQDGWIRMVDSTGKILIEETLNGQKLDLSTLPKGVYFLLLNSNQFAYMKKLVKL